MKINPVVHFEMPADDRNRMANFYATAFGWRTQMLGEDMGNYVLVTTTESKEDGTPKNPGSINGGFYPKNPELTDQYPTVVIAIDDIKKTMNDIKAAGGKLIGEPMEIPGYGLYLSFYDTEGTRVSIMQPFMKENS